MRVVGVGGMNANVDCGEHDANNATTTAATDAVFDDRMVRLLLLTVTFYYDLMVWYLGAV